MATPESTEGYFKRLSHKNLSSHATRILGRTEFQVSGIGFGGYRMHYNSVEHARALRYALLNGFNLIDTSSNYTDGGSEMLIGNILHEMIERQELERDEVVIVSKVGYVQGQNMKVAQENEYQGRPFPDMVKYMDGCWHCLHPDFLEDQLSRSLERLQFPALDLYLMHNPEYFLSDLKQKGETGIESIRDEYYRRIRVAFEWMEDKVNEGKIKAYGISSNSFPQSAQDFEFTSLERVLAAAQYVASDNYLQVIQFPFNLYETGACSEKNQEQGEKTLLDLADKERIATLVNRPLNAMTEDGMVRLASFRISDLTEVQTRFEKELQGLKELEDKFAQEIISGLPEDISRDNVRQVFSMSGQLENGPQAFQNWEHWDHVKQNIILPQTLSYLSYLNGKQMEDAAWRDWSDSYAQKLYDLLDAISFHYENQADARSQEIGDRLDELSEALQVSATLSQKNLQLLTSIEGIHCVLLGMRRTPYVEDAFRALNNPPVSNAEEVLRAFNQTG
jgi:aryl-alcohol dehydrogenase-like predicted oxidoreductase